MNHSAPLPRAALGLRGPLALGLVTLAFVTACAVAPPASPGTSVPSPRPSGTPGQSGSPLPAPTEVPSDGLRVDLDVATPHIVTAVVVDETGSLARATSGRAGDGMSVRWYQVKVENKDDRTVRVTWVGFPADDEVELFISKNDGAYRLRLVQAGPPPNSDALGYDRVLDLEFDEPVSADEVQASIQGSLDTQD